MVWKLDRLARSLKQLIETVEALGERGIGLRSLTESLDTTTSGGTLVFHLFAALAEFERSIDPGAHPLRVTGGTAAGTPGRSSSRLDEPGLGRGEGLIARSRDYGGPGRQASRRGVFDLVPASARRPERRRAQQEVTAV